VRDTYGDCDIVFIQEAKAGAFVQGKPGVSLAEEYDVLEPAQVEAKRDQNCLGNPIPAPIPAMRSRARAGKGGKGGKGGKARSARAEACLWGLIQYGWGAGSARAQGLPAAVLGRRNHPERAGPRARRRQAAGLLAAFR